eukprot:CAMPEP_0117683820 /NCGR_PEP_ID=MMETSP0804-20121206/20665_1 /TAXON_ID=1074897 /ORGANISM="Tetraselmis astigmatica, Strain CCMP880" /LENGTH=85 /DNA_ID=CAMNT_0005494561 /DNA_START=78 /DNA_END=335 /DNA_ORIENTATION=+
MAKVAGFSEIGKSAGGACLAVASHLLLSAVSEDKSDGGYPRPQGARCRSRFIPSCRSGLLSGPDLPEYTLANSTHVCDFHGYSCM